MSAEDAIRAYLAKAISRREFTKRLRALGVTAGAAVTFATLLAHTSAQAEPQTPLTPTEFGMVEAISGRILPTTDTPGAIEAGAVYYIYEALSGPYKSLLPRYQRGLAELDRDCTATYGSSFVSLTPERQDTVLEGLETGKLAGVQGGPAFFELVRRHVMEGVFCEPYYGGNRDMVGWKLVGFPGQRYGYPDAYINKVVDLIPIATDRPPTRGH